MKVLENYEGTKIGRAMTVERRQPDTGLLSNPFVDCKQSKDYEVAVSQSWAGKNGRSWPAKGKGSW